MTQAPHDRAAALGRSCRHYNPLGRFNGGECRVGHPIRKIAVQANGGKLDGLFYKLPCRPGPERIAECPNYDPKTDDEIEADKAEIRASMDVFVKGLSALETIRATMIEGKVASAIYTCPWCNGGRLHVTCAIDFNNHLHARCADCDRGFIE